jgi:hypothetical protein
VGTSLPFLLAPGLHRLEASSEALAQRGWGRGLRWIGEWLRQAGDLEHWAAFQEGFLSVARMTVELAQGRRGRAPASVTFLSGDVHHSYVALAEPTHGSSSVIVQAVCSPIRNPLPRTMRGLLRVAAARPARPGPSPLRWQLIRGPWYDNNLAVLELREDRLAFWWSRGEVRDGDPGRATLHRVAEVDVPLVRR